MRVVTRSDFDGLVCCVILKDAGVADDVKFAHPKDLQDGVVEVTSNDILANVPYVSGCGMWFDHHSSETQRQPGPGEVKGEFRQTPSAARIIYDYYGGKGKLGHLEDLVNAVDKSDSAQFTSDEILDPQGWTLLAFIMDPRTGLGRYKDYRISNYQLMMDMIGHCSTMSVERILALPDVKERVDRYFAQDMKFRDMIRDHTRLDGNVIITDLRGLDEIYTGARFIIYAMYPDQNISIWLIDGKDKQNAVFALGASIINKTSQTDIGALAGSYGGGGHEKAGTLQAPYDDVDRIVGELIEKMKQTE